MKPLKPFGLTVMAKVRMIPLFALTCLVGVPATAQVNYAITNGTAYVAASPNASGDIVIASTFNGYPVTAIADSAFSSCVNLTSVTIPNSVINIRDLAFYNCTSLTNAAIPDSVTTIGSLAFFACIRLMSVTIPNSVTTIQGKAFTSCTNLTNLVLGGGVTSIGVEAFSGCISLTSVTIPNSVINIGDIAFSHCISLTNLMFGSSVINIGNGAFQYCAKLTSVTIPNSVTSLGAAAFSYCTSLTRVTIGNSVNTIGPDGFRGCASLTNITFLGNAPLLFGTLVFYSVGTNATVYYYYGTTGWGPSYGGLPTVMLGAPATQFGAGTAGVKPGGFGFAVAGVVNQTIVIEASTNLATWQPVWTNRLSAVSTNFVDPQWLNHPRRFYRMRSN